MDRFCVWIWVGVGRRMCPWMSGIHTVSSVFHTLSEACLETNWNSECTAFINFWPRVIGGAAEVEVLSEKEQVDQKDRVSDVGMEFGCVQSKATADPTPGGNADWFGQPLNLWLSLWSGEMNQNHHRKAHYPRGKSSLDMLFPHLRKETVTMQTRR